MRVRFWYVASTYCTPRTREHVSPRTHFIAEGYSHTHSTQNGTKHIARASLLHLGITFDHRRRRRRRCRKEAFAAVAILISDERARANALVQRMRAYNLLSKESARAQHPRTVDNQRRPRQPYGAMRMPNGVEGASKVKNAAEQRTWVLAIRDGARVRNCARH